MIRYVHTNLIAQDWRRLAAFYETIFDCVPILPERDLSGEWLEKATNLDNAHIRGIHLRLPGYGEQGPTLEIFDYAEMSAKQEIQSNTPGFSHIAFLVDDVESVAAQVLEAGGSAVGELIVKQMPGVGLLTFQYVADPEGNIIEIQHWSSE